MPDYKEDAFDSLTSVAPTTSTLFHYTSQQGLLGIEDRKARWLSSIRHLNDATEFGYAVDLVRAKLLHKLESECGPWKDYYEIVLDGLNVTDYMTLFVGSFSEHGDLLSQWRAYTPSG